MVDELVIPYDQKHAEFEKYLQKMRSHIASQPGSLLLWISIGGIANGKPEHFKSNYLAPLMTGFHMPEMEMPLRNTTEVIKLAGLESYDPDRIVDVFEMSSNPAYVLPPNLMSGVQCQQIAVKHNDNLAFERALEVACKETLKRTGGLGFPILLDTLLPWHLSSVLATAQRVVGAAMAYTYNGSQEREATEAEVEEIFIQCLIHFKIII